MDRISFISGSLFLASCVNAMVIHQAPRVIRNINTTKLNSDDVTQLHTPTLMETLLSLDGLTVAEVRSEHGDPAVFGYTILKEVSVAMQALPRDQDGVDLRIRARTFSYTRHIKRLGYLIGTGMQTDESRRLSLNDITIYISKFKPSKFRGLFFSSNEGDDMITIPQSVTFQDGVTDVISVSYTVSSLARCMTGRNSTVGSDVIATSLLDEEGLDLALTFSEPLRVNLKLQDMPQDQQPVCSFLRDSKWSTEGCTTVYPSSYGKAAVECHCDHLTIFSALLVDKPIENTVGAAAMFGSGFTILFCLITVLVFIGYRLMNTIRCYIRFSFLTALALAEIMYLCINYTEAPAVCGMIAAGSHFFITASFTWLLSYSLFLGNMLIGETKESLHVTHYTFLGWVIPFAVVLISYIWRYDHYVHMQYCWISERHGLPFAFILPIGFFMVMTLCVLIYDIAIYRRINDPKKTLALTMARSGLRSCCCILPVLSLVWILAYFVVNMGDMWLQVTFSVLNIILGIMLFLIMFWFNEEVQMKRMSDEGPTMFSRFWSRGADGEKSPRPTHKPLEMTMVYRGFSARPGTSSQSHATHSFVSDPLQELADADASSQVSEAGDSVCEYKQSPAHTRLIHAAPIASSEDSLLTRTSVEEARPSLEELEQGRTSRTALLRDMDT